VNALRSKYAGQIEMEIVSTRSPRGERAPDKYGMHHGMLIFNPEGDIFWKKPGHKIGRKEIVRHIEGVLKEGN